MKLKTLPDDFVVEELTDFRAGRGPFALYRLEKRSIGTPEAAQAIARLWNLPRDAVKHGGLKDRHAVTTQHVTIHRGPQTDLQDRSYRLTYLGPCDRHFTAKDIKANRFAIVLRDLHAYSKTVVEDRLRSLSLGGLINYFDDQRFGSLGESREFIAVPWCLGNYERALYLAIAEANQHDRPREREQKAILRAHWGQWAECKNRLDRSHRRSIVTYLVDHPTDFKRALALLRPDLRSIYLAAFQSYLWNRWLSAIIDVQIPASSRSILESACGPLSTPAFTASPAEVAWLSSLELPLPAARQHEWPEPYLPLLNELLDSLQLDVHQLRVKYPRDAFFSRGTRRCWLTVENFQWEIENQEALHSRFNLKLRFSLPRGAYATMIVKYLTHTEDDAEPGAEESIA